MHLFPGLPSGSGSALRLPAGHRRMPEAGLSAVPRSLLRAALPLAAATLALAGCSPLVNDRDAEACVQTRDHGCVPESEYEELVQEIAATHAAESSFQNQWGLEAIGADRAFAHLELQAGPDARPGEGVTVGIVDSGIDASHPSFRNVNVIERFLFGASGDRGDEFSHGTAVASVIAGEDIPGYPYDAPGLAWGADLVMFAIPFGEPGELYEPVTREELPGVEEFTVGFVDAVLNWRFGSERIDFLNLSIGVNGNIESYSEEVLREYFATSLSLMVQEGAENPVVFVWAAGNSHGRDCAPETPHCVDGAIVASSPELYAGMTARIPELRGQTIAVVAVRSDDGLITDFSNRCGIAADYCLAAPGEGINVAYFGPHPDFDDPVVGTVTAAGTSFAAPMVSGGLAMMKSYFRSQLSNPDLLSRLLETADRSGAYADAEIYGRGLMDLGAATSPAGESSVALGRLVGGSGASLRSTTLNPSPAFGDAFAASLGEREIAAFDELGAPFWYEVGDLAPSAARPSLFARLNEFQHSSIAGSHRSPSDATAFPLLRSPAHRDDTTPTLHLARYGASAAARTSHFALAGQGLVATLPISTGLSATAFTTEGLPGQEPASGAAFTWRIPQTSFGLRAGWMGEGETVLGTGSDGAFGSLLADSVFAGIEADTSLGPWRIGGNVEVGTVSARARHGMFGEISPLVTSAFALHATRHFREGAALRVSLSQPLRVEDGRTRLSIPSGRTIGGEVLRRTAAVGLEPSGRQMDLALQWQQPLALGTLRLGATLSHEPGHRAAADPELILLSGWRRTF